MTPEIGDSDVIERLLDQRSRLGEMLRRPIHEQQSAGYYHETFKGLWISPDVKVLLRTDDPTSDGPVAWISPYPKSRVVVIQLGHDHLAQEHPAYRDLVKNSILWAGGRL